MLNELPVLEEPGIVVQVLDKQAPGHGTYPDRKQGWQNILKLIIPWFLVVGVCQLIAYSLIGLDINDPIPRTKTSAQSFVMCFSSFLGTVLIIAIFRKYVDQKTFISLGFQKDFLAKDLVAGLITGFAVMFTGFFILLFCDQLTFMKLDFQLTELFLSMGLFVFVAISEELLLRGYILNNLLCSFNKFTALIISSVIFSLLHAGNPNVDMLGITGLFISGLFFGLAYIYLKSLWFAIALHFSWNFFQGTIFGFNVSGQDGYSVFVTHEASFSIWNGGSFGFESSVLSILFQVIAMAVLFMIYKKGSI